MPENSARSSRWALNNLRSWFDEYNKRNEDDKCPAEILTPSCSKEILNKWLCVYVLETRNHVGQPYPPKTVYSLLCGILREMRVSFKPSVTDSSSSTTGMTGSHYNNCTINVYQQPNYMPPSNYMHPPFQPPFQPPSMMYDCNMPDLGLLDYYNDTKKD